MTAKEEKAIILDFLPYGYPLEKKMMPIAQAMGAKTFVLLELVPRKGVKLESKEEVYIGEGKREQIYYILGRLKADKLTENAKRVLEELITSRVLEDESRFIEFFNTASAINTRLHQFELLPGFGKKHTLAILDKRKEKPFESFKDLKKRVSNLPDPIHTIAKRIVSELKGNERYLIFTQ